MRSFSCTLVLLSPVFASTVGSVVSETYQLDSRFAGATFLDNFDFFTVSQSRRLKSPQPSTRYPNTFPSQIPRQTNAPVGTRPNKRLCKVRVPYVPSFYFSDTTQLRHFILRFYMGPDTAARRRQHLHRRRLREYSRSIWGGEGQCPNQQHEILGNRDVGRS